MPNSEQSNAYDRVLLTVFRKCFVEGAEEMAFSKDDILDAASGLKLRIKNAADILYTYRSRRALPAEILRAGNWVIASRGSGKYAFVRIAGASTVEIPHHLKVYPVPYAVPEIVASHLARDEQGLLTIARYNRLLDVFTGLACFHLQSHVRTQIKGHGQVEIDDLYVGVDKDGQGYVLPVEGKELGESLSLGKAVALTLFGRAKYPDLRCRPIAIVRQPKDVIACVEFEPGEDLTKIVIVEMRRYRLEKGED